MSSTSTAIGDGRTAVDPAVGVRRQPGRHGAAHRLLLAQLVQVGQRAHVAGGLPGDSGRNTRACSCTREPVSHNLGRGCSVRGNGESTTANADSDNVCYVFRRTRFLRNHRRAERVRQRVANDGHPHRAHNDVHTVPDR